ncbi:MAG TPA: carboxypeptidase regulatory-like domain-containing protein, partial [bacterium]
MHRAVQSQPAMWFMWCLLFMFSFLIANSLLAQGVTTGAMSGLVSDSKGEALPGANVVAVHEPSGTQYGTAVRTGGVFNIPNMKIGGPYSVTVTFIGYKTLKEENIFLNLGQNLRLDFRLVEEAIAMEAIEVTAEQDEVLNANRTGAATFINSEEVQQLPSIKRSTRDLIRLDPRADGNYSFAGRNWLFNNISVDGSYFNNPFGLDDPAPGGQTNAEPVPYDAVEQVQVSVAPFDVRQSGFTGASVNTVTKSGTNQFRMSAYSFLRNESLLGNKVSGNKVIANPDLSFNQSGFTLSGPLMRNKLFFFVNGELERTDNPGTNFVANRGGNVDFGESRVSQDLMTQISQRMMNVYGYNTGAFDGFVHETNNDKLLLKLDWNINDNNNLTFRYNFLDASRDLPPHPFVLSPNGSGRGPNENSLPFQNSGYQINNELHSFALEVNSRGSKFANRFFFSYNRFRDFRNPFSAAFPTIDIAENGVTFTTVGHEPFSIHNILDQDVFQFTDNFSLFSGKHVFTFGTNFEVFSFFNSFNIFRHGVFFLPYTVDFEGDGIPNGSTFPSVQEFLDATDPNRPGGPIPFNQMVGTGPFKGENIDVGQFSLYAQDEFLVSERFNLTYGLRLDFPMYFTDSVENPFSRGLTLLDENDNAETLDQSDLPGSSPLFSPRVGFNWDAKGNRSTQLRGGTGIFTGRVPFVWVGNVISNPGNNPNLFPGIPLNQVPDSHRTSDDAILQQSFDLNAMDPDFKWPQVWNTNVAIDQKLPWNLLGTLEFLYGKDINAIFMRNADLAEPVRFLTGGRPFFGGVGNNELNSFFPGSGEGVYVIDNTSAGWNLNLTAQLRKTFDFGMFTTLAYSYTDARNKHKTTEIASVLFQENPVQGDPNKPELSYAEFGQRHRIVGGANYRRQWSDKWATSFGLFLEVAEGNAFLNGGNRFSVLYAGDVNGDGYSNDLIYIPNNAANAGEILFDDIPGGRTAAQQAQAFEAFIQQDDYLNSHRGEIAERFGLINPWYSNIDLRILQDFSLNSGDQKHTFQLSFDILNVANLLDSGWGVRKVASPEATSPLKAVTNAAGVPIFNAQGL